MSLKLMMLTERSWLSTADVVSLPSQIKALLPKLIQPFDRMKLLEISILPVTAMLVVACNKYDLGLINNDTGAHIDDRHVQGNGRYQLGAFKKYSCTTLFTW